MRPDNLAKRTAARLIEKSEPSFAGLQQPSASTWTRPWQRPSTATATSAWEPWAFTPPTVPRPAARSQGAGRRVPVRSTRPSTGRTKDSPSLTAGTDRSTPDWSCPPTLLASSRTISLLLVKPQRADDQRAHEVPPGPPEPPGPPPGSWAASAGRIPQAARRRLRHRDRADAVFRTVKLNPDFYARDFGKITSGDTASRRCGRVQLEVRLEITALAPNGFDGQRSALSARTRRP